jgi:hypothetical protein
MIGSGGSAGAQNSIFVNPQMSMKTDYSVGDEHSEYPFAAHSPSNNNMQVSGVSSHNRRGGIQIPQFNPSKYPHFKVRHASY